MFNENQSSIFISHLDQSVLRMSGRSDHYIYNNTLFSRCYAEFHITPQVVDQIVHCASGDLGAKLQKQAAERTHNVWPDQHMVPFERK